MPLAWEVRFWEKVDKTDDCWNWTGTKLRGYGQTSIGGQTRKAHRVSYEILVGPIPEGLVIDHLCRNRSCVRPDHLEPVPHHINVHRGDQAKITMDDARVIRGRIVAGELMTPLAEEYGVSVHTIHWIAEDIMWREDYDAPRQPVRPANVFCPECGVEITSGKRNKKFCCAQHRTNYNARVARRAVALREEGLR